MAFGVFRFFSGRQELLPLGGHGQGVFHLALGIAGMDAAAVEGNGPVSGVEVFIFKTAQFAAVDGVGKVSAEFFDIEQGSTAACFFVRRKADANRAVLHVRMLDQIFDGADDGRDAGLVVGTEEGRAVGEQDVLTLIFEDFREGFRRKDDVLFFIQDDILAVVIIFADDFDVLPRGIGAGIDVRNEADDRAVDAVGRQGGHDVAVFIDGNVGKAEALQFFG